MRIITKPVLQRDLTMRQQVDAIYYRDRIAQVLTAAHMHGVVITVSNPPNQPLAMGNYDLVVEARPLRNYSDGVL